MHQQLNIWVIPTPVMSLWIAFQWMRNQQKTRYMEGKEWGPVPTSLCSSLNYPGGIVSVPLQPRTAVDWKLIPSLNVCIIFWQQSWQCNYCICTFPVNAPIATTAAWRQLPLKVSAWQQYWYQYDTANTSFRVQVYMYWNWYSQDQVPGGIKYWNPYCHMATVSLSTIEEVASSPLPFFHCLCINICCRLTVTVPFLFI